MFNEKNEDELRRTHLGGEEILAACIALGGSLTGEHGIGIEKRETMRLMFTDADLEAMARLRTAFDPEGLCNPGKVFPLTGGCGEARVAQVPGERP
jgi:FAD/FMN-containing dehydrogenase